MSENIELKEKLNSWQHFGLSFIFHILLPLIPIFFEFWYTRKVSDITLTLSAAIYAVSIGSSSRYMLFFGVTIISSIIFIFAFGVTMVCIHQSQLAVKPVLNITPLPFCGSAAGICILGVAIFHIGERFYRHILNREPYWPWSTK